jgi:hypothetical protein
MDSWARSFRDFSRTAAPRAPLYVELAAGLADDPEVMALLTAARPAQQVPVFFFAGVHDLVLSGAAPDLGAYYASASADPLPPAGAYPVFRRTCLDLADELRATFATRAAQTNEVGRCAVMLPAIDLVAREVGPVSLLDVGASAGLNLLIDRYAYRYEPGGDVGGPSPVTLACGTRGTFTAPAALPTIVGRLGLDAEPVDVRDERAARWLEACVWPDQLDRFERLRAAIAIARDAPPEIRTGDAVADLAATVDDLDPEGHPIVTTTWVLNYLTPAARLEFLAALDHIGGDRDLSWICAESPLRVPELYAGLGEAPEADDLTVLMLTRWRDGERHTARLGVCHPHGFWLHWEG